MKSKPQQGTSAPLLHQQREFWRRQLAGAPILLQLPIDRPRPVRCNYTARRVLLRLSKDLTAKLRAFSLVHGVELFVTLMSGWAALLGRVSVQKEFVIGFTAAIWSTTDIKTLTDFPQDALPLRVRLQTDATIQHLLQQIDSTIQEALVNRNVTFQQIVEASGSSPNRNYHPVFQVSMGFNKSLQSPVDTSIVTSNTSLDLSLMILEAVDFLEIAFDYAKELFERSTVERWADHLRVLLSELVTDQHHSIWRLPLLTRDAREQVLHGFNTTKSEYPPDRLMHESFEERAASTPAAAAVTCGDQSLTFSELNAKANQLATYLVERGVGPDQPVGIYVERSLDMVVGLLGILKAGGSYVPLDPGYPTERLRYVFDNCKPVIVLTQERLKEKIPFDRGRVIALDTDWTEISKQPAHNLQAWRLRLSPQHLAYVIYTSGSTGSPKGVMVEHRQVVRFLAAANEWFHFDAKNVWTLFHSFAFDFSVLELWGALLSGSKLVIVPYETTRSPREFDALLSREKITVLCQTPSAFGQLMVAQGADRKSHFLRNVILGGEALQTSALKAWYESGAVHSAHLTNMYGPTETTVFVTYQLLRADDADYAAGGSPIGRPIAHSRIYILDEYLQPVPIGVTGEIYIGGAGVARGYFNRPELTADRFLADPFIGQKDARMYRSGDLGRWKPDGTIEYLGRNDHQVKIRGFRIELGEIETQLSRQDSVRDAVVLAREDVPGETQLVAYVVPRNPSGVNVESYSQRLRVRLRSCLPAHMVPSGFVILEGLPLTANGKLDRRALPRPQDGAYQRGMHEEPRDEIERTIAKMWEGLLTVAEVGRNDNFFELGGHSLSGIQLIEEMERHFDLPLPASTVFQCPTVWQMAQLVGKHTRDEAYTRDSNRTDSEEGIL